MKGELPEDGLAAWGDDRNASSTVNGNGNGHHKEADEP